MEVLTLIFRLPFLPVQGVIRLAELIEEQAESEYHNPARIRRELEEAQRQRDAGEITDDELAQIEDELTSIMVAPSASPSVGQDE
ncbi:MAG: gas vesicle protein GvpG [Trebonia sp.]